jgi:hypothetical protein
MVKGYEQRMKLRAKEHDALNFLLGRYIGVAVNDPKKYPKRPFLDEEVEQRDMSASEMERMAKINTIKLGGRIK